MTIQHPEFWDAPSDTRVEVIAAVQAGLDDPPKVHAVAHQKCE